MADRLTAAQLADFTGLVMNKKVTRVATIDNDSISATVITDLVKEWGSIKYELFNKHPDDQGKLRFPVTTIVVDNSQGYFSRGGTAFPGGKSDFESTTLRIQITVSGITLMDFTGQVKEPEYDSSKVVRLVTEHPLTAITRRKWGRDDQIGGDTGIDGYFSS